MSSLVLHGWTPFILITCYWLKGPRAGLWELLSEPGTCSFLYSQWGPDVTEEWLDFWKELNVLKVELAIKQMIKLRNINTVKKKHKSVAKHRKYRKYKHTGRQLRHISPTPEFLYANSTNDGHFYQ